MNHGNPQQASNLNKYKGSLLLVVSAQANLEKEVKQFLQAHGLISDQSSPLAAQWFNQPGEPLKIKVVRDFLQQISYSSYDGREQFCILPHIDTGSVPAQNALLKVVEEPPVNRQLVLTAANLNLVLPTIKSRCLVRKLETQPAAAESEPIISQAKARQLSQLLTYPQKLSYARAIDIAQDFQKRPEAIELVRQLLDQLQQLPAEDRPHQTQQNLLTAYQQLNQNLNVKLTLESCFFKIKQTQSK